jgi:hypothetical protein
MAESAIVLSVFLTLVLGMLDLGMATLRYNLASQAARHGVRQAAVHGQLAPAVMGTWGPATIDAAASSSGIPLVAAVQPYLVGFDLDQTRVRAEWLDKSTAMGKRVRVTITTPYKPILTYLFGTQTYTLRGASTMPIAH